MSIPTALRLSYSERIRCGDSRALCSRRSAAAASHTSTCRLAYIARPSVASKIPAFTRPHQASGACDSGFLNTAHSPSITSCIQTISSPGCSRARRATAKVFSSGNPKCLLSSTACQSSSARFRAAPTDPSTSAASIMATNLSSGSGRISAARCTLPTNLYTFLRPAAPWSPAISRAYLRVCSGWMGWGA